MTSIVLVHGAWHGSWYWRPVADLLSAAGHDVLTPTLAGLGARAGELDRSVDLVSHIDEIVALYRFRGIRDSVLVGHSYGGMVVTGAADRLAPHIRSLVHLDAFLPFDGKAALAMQPEVRANDIVEGAKRRGDGWKVPPRRAKAWGLEPEFRDEFDRNAGYHPLATLLQPPMLTGQYRTIAVKTYVEALRTGPGPFGVCAAWTRQQPDWRTLTIDTHHYPMLSAPHEVARIVLEAAKIPKEEAGQMAHLEGNIISK